MAAMAIDLKSLDPARLDDYVAAALWWRDLTRTNNEAFMPLFGDQHRHLVLMGGGGSGKSRFAARKVLERAVTEPGHRFLVVRKVARTLRQSCWKNLLERIADHYGDSGYKVNKTDMVISFPNGSEILFAGLDDVEKLKSIQSITGIWIEEASEILESDFDQLDIRLRGETRYYKQIILTFNPISLTSWLKKRFFDREDPRVRTLKTTFRDNRFLPEEDIQTLEAFRETNPYYYQVYALGQWGVTGKTVFDGTAISRRLEALKMPMAVGVFLYDYDGLSITNIRFQAEEGGPVKVFHMPEAGRPYVVGGDTAGEGSDWFVGQVLDNITGRQAAVLRHQMDEDVYARQMYCLGMWYNTALLGVEANYSTYPVKELQRLGYPRQFVREREDTFDGGIRRSFGFRTDAITRPVIIGGLIQAMRDHYDLIEDEDTLLEMLTFVRPEKNPLRPEAEPGANDDTVLALAIAHYIRGQQSMEAVGPEDRRVQWTEDMWEDYRGADAAGRQYLLAKWGQPQGPP